MYKIRYKITDIPDSNGKSERLQILKLPKLQS